MRPNFAKVLLAVFAVFLFASVCANAQNVIVEDNGTFIISPTGEKTAVQCVMSFPFLKGLEAIESDVDPKLGENVVAATFSGMSTPMGANAIAATSPTQTNNVSTPIFGEEAQRRCACADSFRAFSREPIFIPRR